MDTLPHSPTGLARPRLLAAVAACSLLSACSLQPREQPPEHPEPIQVQAAEPEPEQPTAYETRAFPIESFYTLLVAEVAGNREHYDLALANYYHQAEHTQDAGVAARATRIARFLNARRAALRSAQLWAQLEPDNAEAHLAATAELTLAGQLEAGLVHAKRALDLGGDPPLQSLAAAAAADGEVEEATLEHFRRLAEKYPRNGEAALAYALLLRTDSQLDAALALTRSVQEREPDLLDAPLLESHILIDQGKHQEAQQLMEQLVRIYPSESRLRLQYARLLVRDDLELAQEQFEELVRQRPNDGNMLLSLALIRLETGNHQAARALFEQLLEMDEHESAAHYYLGGIAEREGDLVLAVTHYRMVRPGNDYVPAITRGTQLLAATGEHKHNKVWFSELRARHPGQAEHFFLLEAELLRKHQQHRQAHALLQQAVETNPESGRLIYAHALASEYVGDIAGFERGILALLERDPENPSLLNTLGYKLLNYEERLDDALEFISRALQLRPDDPAIIDSMGWAMYRLGRHAEALEYLHRAMEQMPDHEIAAHLGEVLWVKGEREQAVRVWNRGLQINPDSKIIPEAMQRLRGQESVEQHASES